MTEPRISVFRTKDYLDGMSRPAIEDENGVVYTGRLMSFEEVLPLQAKIEDLQDEKITPQQMKELVADICRAIDIPPEVVLKLPPKIMIQAVIHFFKSMFGQETSSASSSPSPPTSMSG